MVETTIAELRAVIATLPASPARERLGQLLDALERDYRLDKAEMREVLMAARLTRRGC